MKQHATKIHEIYVMREVSHYVPQHKMHRFIPHIMLAHLFLQ